MKPGFCGVAMLLTLAACASSMNASPDGSAGRDSEIQGDSTSRADGDGGTQCSFGEAQIPDLALSLPDSDYDGPVMVRSGQSGPDLVAASDGGSLGVVLSGVLATMPEGTTLWAELHQQTVRSNPFAFPQRTTSWTLRPSQQDAVLAGGLLAFVPSAQTSTTFLGVPVTASPLCSRAEVNNVVTGVSCMTSSYFKITVHGDRDLTLQPGAAGRLSIGGQEYEVWLGSAFTETITMNGCVADWVPPVGLTLIGRAARFRDIVAAGP